MGKTQKVLMVALWALLVVAMVGIVATRATRSQQPEQQDAAKFAPLYAAPTFQLTDQNGKPFGSDDLRGKVWIADFIFTHCAGACQVMSGHLQDVQKKLTSSDVKLVSFSVDPQRDTPEALKEFAGRFDADEGRWKFLTGTSEQMAAVAEGMKVAAKVDATAGVIHSEYFLLVDRAGQVCGIYHKDQEPEMKHLAADADELAGKSPEKTAEHK
jgi:cytochrome oxidase Cu insertion factor (SCO1/SenC/PrrC family)